MTELLAKVFGEAEKLPPEEQDRLAATILEEMESGRRFDVREGATPLTSEMVADALDES